MRRLSIFHLVFFLVLTSTMECEASAQPRKRALLIGISDYTLPTSDAKFGNLDTENDIESMINVLKQKFQFKDTEIKALQKKGDTTRESILSAFRELVSETKEGDIVFFYYAGHGSQVADPNEPDGLDETIVPSDYANDGSKDIRDKEIAELLGVLKNRHPAAVMLGFDSCHSATAFRAQNTAFNKVRGISYEARFGKKKPQPGVTSRSMTRLVSDNPLGASFVVFSASQDDSLAVQMANDEGQPMGRLSYFLSKALLASGPQSTYGDVFELIEAQMAQRFPGQVPSIEGEKNKLLLQGIALPVEKYAAVYISPNNNIMLRAGFLNGMTKDSVFAIYPSGTKEFNEANKAAEAKIASVKAGESVLTVTRTIKAGFKREDLQGARAVETLHKYSDDRIKLDLHDFNALPDKSGILTALQSLITADGPINADLSPGQQPDVRLLKVSQEELDQGRTKEKTPNAQLVTLALIRNDDGSIIEPLPESDERSRKIYNALLREAKYRTVRLLNNESQSSGVQTEMRVVPAEVTQENGMEAWQRDRTNSHGGKVFEEGEWLTIEVRNIGTQDAFITVLDLQSDGSIGQLWPPLDPQRPVTNKLSKAQTTWHKLWTGSFNTPWPIQITKPYGVEMFKLIATPTKVDLSDLATRGSDTSLQRALKFVMSGKRAELGAVPDDWFTSTVVLTVKKPGNNP